MGRTSTAKSNPSATSKKGSAPKRVSSDVDKMKKSIELVVKNDKTSPTNDSKSAQQVDSHVPNASMYEVATDSATSTTLSTYLNWSDLKKNHNKFYI